ncbi:SpoIIE family protein phosphatase [Streptacidiphilus griseoplanus]|uniref:SpoIIE family protein phosphatase n=1 Tax=Peterkaempfera griseoplana TaxID=66896 RepID=UPI00099E4C5F|nr:SpoIIE family protein phosphatase [Peterkaempfera griseoplana]
MPARDALTGSGALPGRSGRAEHGLGGHKGRRTPVRGGERSQTGVRVPRPASAADEPAWAYAEQGQGEPGSIYDYIRVAAFAIGADGRISQWSDRAAEFFGVAAEEAVGADPVTALMPRGLWREGRARLERILAGEEWVGTAPYREASGGEGVAEVYVMPSRTEDDAGGAVCLAVDLRKLRRIETDLAASEAVFGQTPTGFFLFDRQLRLQRVNDAFAAGIGLNPEDLHGLRPYDIFPRTEAERLTAALRQVLESGEAVVDMRFTGPAPMRDGARKWSVSLYRLVGANDRPMGVAGQITDVTRRQRDEREAASVRRNLALLNEASAHIGSTLDLETTAKELLDVVVPRFCDVASVDLYSALLTGDTAPIGTGGPAGPADGAGELRRVAVSSAVGGASAVAGVPRAAEAARVGGTFCYPPRSPHAKALRTGRSVIPDTHPDPLVRSTLVVPLVARNVVLGLVQLSRAKGSEPFDQRDVVIAQELVARAAVCVDNARLYRREHERALILQRSLLPPGNPAASGLEIACRYLPGSSGTEVGGDWFDVIPLPGNRTALVVGDVMGRGLRAAVAMGQLRTAVRTLAMLDLDPAEVLTALDEIARGLGDGSGTSQLSLGSGPSLFGQHQPLLMGRRQGVPAEPGVPEPDGGSEVYLATCVYAVYDAVTRRCTIANAGHLPPVLLAPGEDALMLDVPPGLPLGVGGEIFEEVEVELPDGALLGLYTDGLVESRKHQLEEGLEAFRQALSGPSRGLEDLCDRVLGELDPHHGEDDIALLMARIHALPDEAVGDWRLPPEPTSVARARELAIGWLLARGLDDLVDTTELLVSELATNALRHGSGDIRLRLLRDTTVVCEVWDNGYAQPRQRRAQETDEGGRGLQLVSLLAERWGSRRTPKGKIVWFELALPQTSSLRP